MTAFSEFIRSASVEEKQAVYDKVIKESCLSQRRAMGIPTGDFVAKFYENQPVDSRKPLAEIIDNAIGMTMQACWGIEDSEVEK